MIEPNSELIIDFELVRNNIQEIKKKLPKHCNFMGVIKSDAYGHDLKIATNAIKDVVDGFGAVRLDEALVIRENSSKPILAMQGVYSSDAYDLIKQKNIWTVVHSISQLPLAKQYQNNLISCIFFLRALCLKGNAVGATGASALALVLQSDGNRLQTLDLQGCEGLKGLPESLTTLR